MPGESARVNGRKGGRPKGRKSHHTLEKEAAREFVRQRITQALEPLLDAQIQHALGLKYLVTRSKAGGKFIRVTEAMARARQGSDEEIIEVWEKDPSVQAFTDLLNRAIDKPKEQAFEVQAGVTEELVKKLDYAKERNRAAQQAAK